MKMKSKKGAFIGCAIVLALAAPSTPAATLTQYWPLDESPGASVSSNLVAGGNTAVLVNADTNSAWINGDVPSQLPNSTGAVTLDGVNDYVNLGVFGLNNPASISMWIKPNDLSGDVRLITPLDFNANYAGLFRFDTFGTGMIQEISNIPGSWGNTWFSVADMTLVPLGQWTHFAAVYSAGGVVTLYINGVKAGQVTGGFRFSQSQFGLGAQFNGTAKSFSGSIDDVSVWKGALSPESVALLAQGTSPTNIVDAPPPLQPAQLIQYFPLDDGTGSITATNAVGTGNTGDLIGFDSINAWTTNALPSALSNSKGALIFDGVDDYVNLGKIGLFGSGAISLWIKPVTNNSDSMIYAQLSGSGNSPGLLKLPASLTGGLQTFNSSAYVTLAQSNNVPANQWTHVVVSCDNGFSTAYINGVPQFTAPAAFAYATDAIGLGANFRLATGKKFSGVIDDVSIWNWPLSAASVQQLASGVSPLDIVDVPQGTVSLPISYSIESSVAGAQIKQYFPLEGLDDATNAANLVVGGNTGKLVNYVTPLPPWTNNALAPQLAHSTAALALDGLGNYANLGNVGLSGSATVSLWIKANVVTNGGQLFGQLSGVTSAQGAVGLAGSGGLQMRGVTGLAPDGTIHTNQWTHLAFLYSAGLVSAYVNGTLINTVAASCDFSNDPFGIGAPLWYLSAPLYNNFPGQIDDVALWSAPISEAEVQSLASGASPLTITNTAPLVQYFPLEGTGMDLNVTNAVAGGNTGQLANYTSSVHSWDSSEHPAQLSGSTRSLFLNGISEYLNIGNVGLNGSGTVSLWLKPTTLAGDQRLLSQLTGATTQQGHSGFRPDGQVWTWAGNVYQYPGPAGTLTAGQWHHLVFTFGGGLATLYVNGIEKGTAQSGLQFNNVEMGIGAKWINLYGNSVSGFIDDVAVWDKPLFPDSIASLAAGTPPNAVVDSPKNLVLRWPASGGYFSMETATNVAGPWTPVLQSAALSGTNLTIAVPLSSNGMKFYRLVARQ